MNRWRRLQAALWGTAWSVGAWLAARRQVRWTLPDEQAQTYRTQTRGMGLRMTERLRDQLRPGWLRVVRVENDEPGDRSPAGEGG